MKSNRIKLGEIKVKSFVTSLNLDKSGTIRGGNTIETRVEECPDDGDPRTTTTNPTGTIAMDTVQSCNN